MAINIIDEDAITDLRINKCILDAHLYSCFKEDYYDT